MRTAMETPRIESGDIVRGSYVVRFGDREFIVLPGESRIAVVRSGEKEPAGFLKWGSRWSGSIWKAAECIGEYSETEGGKYAVVPVSHGRKFAENAVEIDPLAFLLKAL